MLGGVGGRIQPQQQGLAAVTKVAVADPASSLASHIRIDLGQQECLSRTASKS